MSSGKISHVRISLRSVLFVLVVFLDDTASFRIKNDRQFKHCEFSPGFGARMWFTEDKRTVWLSLDGVESVNTSIKRILLYPQTDEEKALQNYFLVKEFPYLDVFLDDTASFTQPNSAKKESPGKPWKRILRQVSTWMLEHKYLETDPRIFHKFAASEEDRYFQRVNYRQFPIPVLKKLHPIVEEECRKGVLQCLKLVHEYAHAHMQHFNKFLNTNKQYFMKYYNAFRRLSVPDHAIPRMALVDAKRDFCSAEGDLGWTWFAGQGFAPFLSWNDLFEFRTTASYYLCNYTISEKRLYQEKIRQDTEQGASVATPPNNQYSNDQAVIECLFSRTWSTMKDPIKIYHMPNMFYTLATMDGFHCKNVGPCQIPIKGTIGRIWEDDFALTDFSCALSAFCPDPCCGAFRNSLQDPTDIDQCRKPNPDFPCRDGGQTDDCQLDAERNSNFHDLIQNRINISCGCNEQKGKKWNSFLSLCLDIDECQEQNPCHPEMEVCVNRLDGKKPLCVCEFGFYRYNATSKCVPDPSNQLHNTQALGWNVSASKSEANGSTPMPRISDEAALQQAIANIEGFFGLKSLGSRLYRGAYYWTAVLFAFVSR